MLINTDHGSFSREWDCGIDNLCKAEMYTTPSRRVIFFRSETRLDCELDAVGANAVAFGGVAAGSTRGARAGRRISSLVGCVSVDRATAVFGAISVNLQMLKKVEEISPKLEKSTQVTQILEDSLEPFEMASPAPTRRVTPHPVFCSASGHVDRCPDGRKGMYPLSRRQRQTRQNFQKIIFQQNHKFCNQTLLRGEDYKGAPPEVARIRCHGEPNPKT